MKTVNRKKKVIIPLYGGRLIIHQVSSLKKIEKKHNLTDTTGCLAYYCSEIEKYS